jgi:hypothetical protein
VDWIVWKKQHGFQEAAAGEGRRYAGKDALPTNEEMNL